MKLVLATHNDGKTVEMQHALSYLPVEVLTLKHFPQIGDIPETGSTLLENAFIKAETVYRETGIPSLADDTGLEIKACLLYTSPSPRDRQKSRMPSSA